MLYCEVRKVAFLARSGSKGSVLIRDLSWTLSDFSLTSLKSSEKLCSLESLVSSGTGNTISFVRSGRAAGSRLLESKDFSMDSRS